jgi:hypothetical protein
MKNRTNLACAPPLNVHQPIGIISHRSFGRTLIKLALIVLALNATPTIQAQTCENVGDAGSESISASIKTKDTNIAVTDTSIRLDRDLRDLGITPIGRDGKPLPFPIGRRDGKDFNDFSAYWDTALKAACFPKLQ